MDVEFKDNLASRGLTDDFGISIDFAEPKRTNHGVSGERSKRAEIRSGNRPALEWAFRTTLNNLCHRAQSYQEPIVNSCQ